MNGQMDLPLDLDPPKPSTPRIDPPIDPRLSSDSPQESNGHQAKEGPE